MRRDDRSLLISFSFFFFLFFLSEFCTSPYFQTGDDGFTPSLKSLGQMPSQQQARQKALYARREKAQRQKRALEGGEGEERPRFNISRPGQLFHDDEMYVFFILSTFLSFFFLSFFDLDCPDFLLSSSASPVMSVPPSISHASTSTASSSTHPSYTASPYPAKYFQTENMALSLNQFLAQKKEKSSATSPHATPQSAQPGLASPTSFAAISNAPVSPECMRCDSGANSKFIFFFFFFSFLRLFYFVSLFLLTY
jgi:hypothetical protein